MTEEQINIAIAEACGYEKHEKFHRWRDPQTKESLCWKSLPDCCSNLNVMHEVWVAKIEGNEVLEDLFTIWLGAICCGEPISDRPDLSDANIAIVTNATARQRAEAFLRTIDKWKGASGE